VDIILLTKKRGSFKLEFQKPCKAGALSSMNKEIKEDEKKAMEIDTLLIRHTPSFEGNCQG
jgi:hypothetical protein